jgi:DNA gyrase/topoisomerase IV subunit B
MTWKSEPTVSPSDKEDFTRISFKPDLAKFGMEVLDPDTVALLTRRVYDIAGTNLCCQEFTVVHLLSLRSILIVCRI